MWFLYCIHRLCKLSSDSQNLQTRSRTNKPQQRFVGQRSLLQNFQWWEFYLAAWCQHSPQPKGVFTLRVRLEIGAVNHEIIQQVGGKKLRRRKSFVTCIMIGWFSLQCIHNKAINMTAFLYQWRLADYPQGVYSVWEKTRIPIYYAGYDYTFIWTSMSEKSC